MSQINKEIERKFIINDIPENLNFIKRYKIKQGYIFCNKDFEIRLRQKGEKYFQTIKQGSGIERFETEIELSLIQFEQMWPLTKNKRIEKERLEIKQNSYTIELDKFSGKLKGLILAEIEFEDIVIAKSAVLPHWFDKEVTYDENYKNKNLALNGMPR